MKHLLEYEDHDIKDLLGDLEGIGQSKKVKASVWIEYLEGRASDCIKRVILTDEFYASGDRDADAKQVLQKIAGGEFEYSEPPKPSAGRDLPETPGIYLFPREDVQQLGEKYLKDFDRYKKVYGQRNKVGNGLDAFASDLGSETLDKFKEEDSRWWIGDDLKSNFKVFIAPPNSPYHDRNSMYTLPNPVDVVEYDAE